MKWWTREHRAMQSNNCCDSQLCFWMVPSDVERLEHSPSKSNSYSHNLIVFSSVQHPSIFRCPNFHITMAACFSCLQRCAIGSSSWFIEFQLLGWDFALNVVGSQPRRNQVSVHQQGQHEVLAHMTLDQPLECWSDSVEFFSRGSQRLWSFWHVNRSQGFGEIVHENLEVLLSHPVA